ncbi:hypothetical protein [Ensifer sp. SSB1]|jgi:hypothetical protein|uniref:hypothetical protein n=1 Tax=Ensifer sp. SSB1 TaxID=2795385 RepID=UPI001A3BE813|nr:hypothetical protein [Ensifer sp. SSB1]MBK5566894.1 hypothetical protein [Ensifer sp. SSB1]
MTSGMQALNDFVDTHGIERSSTGRCTFDADVDFVGDHNRAVEETEVTISFHTGDRNQVRMTPKGDLTLKFFHMDFADGPQEFQFDGQILTITGNSQKMDNYKVTVQPAR